MGKKSAPSPPDPVATTQAQGAANIEAAQETARLNQFNQVSPFGSLTFSGELGSPSRTATTTLNPTAQQAFNQQQNLALSLSQFGNELAPKVRGALSQPLLGEQGVSDFANRAERGYFDRAYGLLSPEFARREKALVTDLVNRGLPRSGEAFNREYRDFNRQRDDAYERLAQDAIFAGQQYGTGLLGQQSALRGQPINELAALLQGSPAINVPQFGGIGQVGVNAPDVLGAQQLAYGGQLNAFNQQQQMQRGLLSGLFGLGGAWLGRPT